MKRQLSTKDWELLSSYLDGELNPREKARVEVLLNAQPDYKEALDGLRRTKSILHRAPVRKVPHNFTLTAADVQPVKTPGWLPTMQWSSVAAALVAVFLFVYQLVPGLSGARATLTDKSVDNSAPTQELAAPQAAAGIAAAATPEIIFWGGPPAPVGAATGLGGGGGGGSGQPGDCSAAGAMCGGGAAEPAPTEMPFPQPPIPNSLPDLQLQPTEAVRIAAKEPVTGTGPILGVRPEEQQGTTLASSARGEASSTERESTPTRQPRQILIIVAGGLLLIAIALMVAAILLKRKMQR